MTLEEVMQLDGKGVGPTVAAYALLGKQKNSRTRKIRKLSGAKNKEKQRGRREKQRGETKS